MKGPSLSLAFLLPFAVATGSGAVAEKPKGLSVDSPFAPAGAPATAGAVTMSSETIEFAGVTTIGKETSLVFFDKLAKKSHWLKKGETKAGITLVNYDAAQEKAVVRLNGAEKVLPLRKGKGATGPGHVVTPVQTGFNTPAPESPVASTTPAAPPPATPAPVVPSGPPTPETQARQETEARMLVSDLLEIGMAQRRAYEEAQRKAAEAGANPPAAPSPETPPPAIVPPRQP
jgi:hypothetical protein